MPSQCFPPDWTVCHHILTIHDDQFPFSFVSVSDIIYIVPPTSHCQPCRPHSSQLVICVSAVVSFLRLPITLDNLILLSRFPRSPLTAAMAGQTPWLMQYRSSEWFIILTVAVATFTVRDKLFHSNTSRWSTDEDGDE